MPKIEKIVKYSKKFAENVKTSGLKCGFEKGRYFLKRRSSIRQFNKVTGLNWSFTDKNHEVNVYNSHFQENNDFSANKTEIKPIVFYLPQFHRIKENDEWWGEGFTEWTNTKKCTPKFFGHYQPREPHEDIGYYDLANISTLERQVALAKQHGIYGFCFYYYWFSGRRIMEKPVDMLLEHKEISTNFCLCWANENFTRTWDGLNNEVLLGQEYSEKDKKSFIEDIKKYVDDPRYIRIDGKPLIVVYNPGQIPEIKDTFSKWRKRAAELGIGEILIWTCQTANNTAESLDIFDCIDGEVEFPPHNMWHDIIGVKELDLHGKSANIYNYRKLVEMTDIRLKEEESKTCPLYHTCMMGWDNAARRDDLWTTFYGYSLKSFYQWVTAIIENTKRTKDDNNQIFFVNAWNEWAEGTYLEPDKKYGYANINTFSKALFEYPFDPVLRLEGNTETIRKLTEDVNIAVQIHMFYIDRVHEIAEMLNWIPYPFDVFISTDSEEKAEIIRNEFNTISNSNHCYIEVFENRGRDVRPFLLQMKGRYNKYKYICHLHTKKTLNDDYGTMWCDYLFRNLFGSMENINAILSCFEKDESLGLIFPDHFPVISKQVEWGDNEEDCQILMEKMGIDTELDIFPEFPAGNMFWARTEAISPMIDLIATGDHFPDEAGQLNQTLAHQIERLWCYVARNNHYRYQKIYNAYWEKVTLKSKKRMAIYVHFDVMNIISEMDFKYIKVMAEIVDEFYFVTNSKLSEKELSKIDYPNIHIICRENRGYDFGAWKETIFKIGRQKIREYDELFLINNSCDYINQNLPNVINTMEEKKLDFWGITCQPFCRDGKYIGKRWIEEHIQSYFVCFSKNLLNSEVFWNFWGKVELEENIIDVIKKYETEMTKFFSNHGFKYNYYIQETKLLSQIFLNYAIPYKYPYSLLILNNPLIKKKAYQLMSQDEKNKVYAITKQI